MQELNELTKRLFTKKTIDKYLKLSKYLNEDYDSVSSFLLIRLFSSLVLFILLFMFSRFNLVYTLIFTVLYWVLLKYMYYDRRIKIKEKVLEKDADFFFEILLLSLKSGKNLLQAIEITIDNVDNEFSNELNTYMKQMKYGKSLLEILRTFKDNVSSDNIKNILIGLEESYLSGKDMVKSLEKELRLLEQKRINDIKVYINKLPIKISVISVFILIPLMLLLILSPIIIEYFG